MTAAEPKVLPLFGSGKPLCFCGAEAEPFNLGLNKVKVYTTLCRVHRKSERELTAEAEARADQRLRELGA